MKIKGLLTLSILLLTACHGISEPVSDGRGRNIKPGPIVGSCAQRICTMQYDPVCATIEENGRTRQQTFGNSCTVCTENGRIVHTRKGACERAAIE